MSKVAAPPILRHEVRCPSCGKRLFDALVIGGMIEVRCDRCKALVRWPSPYPEIVVGGDDGKQPARPGANWSEEK